MGHVVNLHDGRKGKLRAPRPPPLQKFSVQVALNCYNWGSSLFKSEISQFWHLPAAGLAVVVFFGAILLETNDNSDLR